MKAHLDLQRNGMFHPYLLSNIIKQKKNHRKVSVQIRVFIVQLQTGALVASAISLPSTNALFCYVIWPNYSASLLLCSDCTVVGANGSAVGYPEGLPGLWP